MVYGLGNEKETRNEKRQGTAPRNQEELVDWRIGGLEDSNHPITNPPITQ